MRKADYVRSAPQSRAHACHWPGCSAQVPPALWGCKPHWFLLPKAIRDDIWSHYRPGQEERLDPSAQYLRAADNAQAWIRDHLEQEAVQKREADKFTGDLFDGS